MLLAGCWIKDRQSVAGPVDEQLLTGKMRLPHRRRDALPPVAVPLAEPAVGEASGVLGPVLLPQQSQRHPAPLQLRMDVETSPARPAPHSTPCPPAETDAAPARHHR